jgi:hypothetical protein
MIKTSIVCWQPSVAFRPKKLNRPQRISTGGFPFLTKPIVALDITDGADLFEATPDALGVHL